MLTRTASILVPTFGHLTVTSDTAEIVPGSIIAPNHDSLADPVVTLAALHHIGINPVIMATAGLWRIPLLGRALTRGGHIAVHRRTARAAHALEDALVALDNGRHVLIYGEGRLPLRKDAASAAPESFRTGLARLAQASRAPVVPIGHAGARRITSGSRSKQIAGVLTAPLRRPRLHVHVGAPVFLTGDIPVATEQARRAVAAAWGTAALAVGEAPALAS